MRQPQPNEDCPKCGKEIQFVNKYKESTLYQNGIEYITSSVNSVCITTGREIDSYTRIYVIEHKNDY